MSHELKRVLDAVCDEESFVCFLEALAADHADEVEKENCNPSPPYNPGANGWENGTIEAFLEALRFGPVIPRIDCSSVESRFMRSLTIRGNDVWTSSIWENCNSSRIRNMLHPGQGSAFLILFRPNFNRISPLDTKI